MTSNDEETHVSAATYGVMLLVFVTVGRIQELVPYLEKFHLGKIVFALCLVLAITGPRNKLNSLTGIVQIKYIAGIFICALISIPFSYWPGGSFSFITTDYLKTLLAFFLIIIIVRNIQEIHKIIWALAGSLFALSFTVLISGGTGRLSASSTYDPNDLAFVLVTFMPMIYYFMKGKVGFSKIVLQATLIAMLLALMATASRGGVVGLIIIVVVILLKHGEKIFHALFPLTILLVLMSLFAPATFWDRMSTMLHPQEDYNVSAGGGRVDIWIEGIKMMIRHPLTGVGINCFEVAEGSFHTDAITGNSGKWSSPHNSFIQVGAELGFIGLILFLKLLTSSIKSLRTWRKNNELGNVPNWLLDSTEVAFYGYITTGFFLSQAYSVVFYFLIALVVIIQRIDIQLKSKLTELSKQPASNNLISKTTA
jgi:O-antigen ligase